MKVLASTFPQHKDGQYLLSLVRDALKSLCGVGRNDTFGNVPPKLTKLAKPGANGEESRLLSNYGAIWKSCSVQYNERERGASISPQRVISLGPFFASNRWKVKDIEKVLLHEYLHKAVSLQPNYGDRDFRDGVQHGEIDQIIEFELHYPPPANPGIR